MKKFILVILFLSLQHNISFAQKITLSQSLEIALKNNLSIIEANQDYNTAQAKTMGAWSTIFPKLTLETSGSRIHSNTGISQMAPIISALGPSFNIPAEDYVDNYSLKLSFNQIIYGSHVFAALQAASYGELLAKRNLDHTKNNAVFSTKEAFYNVLKAEEMLSSTLESQKAVMQIKKRITEMVEVGLASKSDLLRIELQLNTIDQSILQLKNALSMAKNSFNLTIGEPIATLYDLDIKDAPREKIVTLNTNSLTNQAIAQRNDIKLIDYQIKLYNTQIAAIASECQPNIFLAGNVELTNSEEYSFDFDGYKNWILTLAASWKFFDGGDNQSKVDEVKSTIRKLKAQRKQLINAITFQVKSSRDAINLSLAQMSTAQKEIELATENEAIAKEMFIHGGATNIEVVDAVASLIKAKSNYINAKYDYEITKAKLNHVIGSKYETGANK